MIPTVHSYAVDHINHIHKRALVHPTILLALGRCHGIPEWIGPAIRHLIDTPLSSIASDPEVLPYMSLETHLVITRLRDKLQLQKLHLTLRAPDVTHAKDCADNRACSNAWDSTWLNIVGRKVLHPDVFQPSWPEIKTCAESLQVPEMCHLCFLRVLSNVWDIEI